MAIETVASTDAFKVLVAEVTAQEGYREPMAFGIARVDRGQKNAEKVLQANFPLINWKENFGSAAVFIKALQEAKCDVDFSGSEFVATINDNFVANAMAAFAPYLAEATGDSHKNVQVIKTLAKMEDIGKNFRIVFLFEDANPESVEAVYLKLYALSLRKAELRKVNLNGAFGILSNVAWVGNTPYELDYLRENEIEMKLNGTYPTVDSVDKFPRFLQHVIPDDNTRILEASKVRMGAQLAAGTTVMPGASYINFNAGTLGPVMVEGRISSSAIVGAGSDVGGGASILGVLSGTDGNPISIGENTLLGANSVTGLPLGDGCIVDAGITILAGTKIKIAPEELEKIKAANPDAKLDNKTTFKGEELQGLNGIHYRQNSLTGEIIARRSTREVKLNEDLH
ncbi:tetrahydrodipicolinate N-succinyltransferase N-terminal domain-containing protein [Sulfurovum sp. NBC37-1]|uniref:2,3,4,5-tetrahydropyridine-2,6-dicarboxylate N-succinyltransferase n=1 Tax=Sulfurovum sp. (strain NBC37-1) TaxID=387093 RepID=DAPD_SULNB|nr:tetrahydrodipicolinate N-succinyltransferase N-terminal domain-containing protein [Sulfurovum sp. NBC37-1]A6QAM9.1 RecName: Full=2,3,4,5-tetrahydropyridine-2,6-dicarboxylate N-succinyltransferase; AltName: Full=Tetrahydrodipicolinate N-succinyltransferase; Short=THDP succinyltransferase; Short=THP succinyltransferase; AltName: Full=Tetrahydropicolinate succinylase [Sulfurovum sp. NBC37-1]BAF72538.1 tetrahydrodipicolinate N-succinyltransferase [Sulfurovum sp. NBC37-1]